MNRAMLRIADKHEIHEVVLRYCRGIDRLDFDLVRSAYHADGIDHHTGFDGTVDEYITWVRPLLEGFSGTMHMVGNHLSEVYGDRAIAETYGNAFHWGQPESDPRRNFVSGFRYVDLMANRSGRWAIVERYAVREWTHSTGGVQLVPEAAGPRAKRDTTDPYYLLAGRARDAEGTSPDLA